MPNRVERPDSTRPPLGPQNARRSRLGRANCTATVSSELLTWRNWHGPFLLRCWAPAPPLASGTHAQGATAPLGWASGGAGLAVPWGPTPMGPPRQRCRCGAAPPSQRVAGGRGRQRQADTASSHFTFRAGRPPNRLQSVHKLLGCSRHLGSRGRQRLTAWVTLSPHRIGNT